MNRIPFSEVGQYRQLALVRLLLAFTGQTHEWLLDYGDRAASILRRSYHNPTNQAEVITRLERAWTESFAQWRNSFQSARRQAAAFAFGELAVSHRHFMELVNPSLQESEPTEFPLVFEPQLQEVLEAAARRVHGDGFNLSQRIWRLDRESFNGIKRTVQAGIAESKSAWQLAQDVEQYLGAGADCPRWTSTRLYRLTKKDIAAGDRRGLLKGPACDGRGVAYNALRLARTEISFAHNGATEMIHRRSPWVEGVKVNLSPAHPEPDICDDFAKGGPESDGVYRKGDVRYPPYHPHCLCFMTSVQMADEEFIRRMREWLAGGSWPEMDVYQDFVGGNRFSVSNPALIVGAGEMLVKWLFELPKGDDYEQLRLFESHFLLADRSLYERKNAYATGT